MPGTSPSILNLIFSLSTDVIVWYFDICSKGLQLPPPCTLDHGLASSDALSFTLQPGRQSQAGLMSAGALPPPASAPPPLASDAFVVVAGVAGPVATAVPAAAAATTRRHGARRREL